LRALLERIYNAHHTGQFAIYSYHNHGLGFCLEGFNLGNKGIVGNVLLIHVSHVAYQDSITIYLGSYTFARSRFEGAHFQKRDAFKFCCRSDGFAQQVFAAGFHRGSQLQ